MVPYEVMARDDAFMEYIVKSNNKWVYYIYFVDSWRFCYFCYLKFVMSYQSAIGKSWRREFDGSGPDLENSHYNNVPLKEYLELAVQLVMRGFTGCSSQSRASAGNGIGALKKRKKSQFNH